MVSINPAASGVLIFITAGFLAFFLDPATIDPNEINPQLDASTIIQAHSSPNTIIENVALIDEYQPVIIDSLPPSSEPSNHLINTISPYFVELCNRTPQFCQFVKDSKNDLSTKLIDFQNQIEPHYNKVVDKVTLFLEEGETEFFEDLWSDFWNQDTSFIVLEMVALPLVLVLLFELFVAILDLNLDVVMWFTKKLTPAKKVPQKSFKPNLVQVTPATTKIPNSEIGTTLPSSTNGLEGSDSAILTAELGQEFYVRSSAPAPGLNAGTLAPSTHPSLLVNPKDTAKVQLDTLFAHHKAIFGFAYRVLFWKVPKTSWIAFGSSLVLALFITWINPTLISLLFLAVFSYVVAWWAAEYNSLTWSYLFPDPEGDTAAAVDLIAYWKAVYDDITSRKQIQQRRAPRQFNRRMILVWFSIFLLVHITNRYLLAVLLVTATFFVPKKYVGKKEAIKKRLEYVVLGKAK